ncbi:MAG: aspartate-semialdehyde dehydrogenase [Oscillospiraceae bacterium]|nr:aspartate-semialdehyde dehydrogenase [Oscillospiraceae bacterium]
MENIYKINQKLNAGIIGATGMVGQRFITLLAEHPWFNITALAASPKSAGKKYAETIEGRWKMTTPIPEKVKDMMVFDASDVEKVSSLCDFVFSAVDMPTKDEVKKIEEAYAKTETPVISNDKATRGVPDVPMFIPEINSPHAEVIEAQRKRLGTKTGFIAVKPNCSIQSYVPMLTPLLKFGLKEVVVSTYQSVSGASKTFNEMPEIIDNVIPYIGGGEEEKSETEPMKIWGSVKNGVIENITKPIITSQCVRVPVSDGHLATVFINFDGAKPSKEEIIQLWREFKGEPQELNLPSAPKQFIYYFDEIDRPQTKLDRDLENGMAVSAGRLREDSIFDYKFIGLSHNTLRGAAGGGVLTAEYLYKKGYIVKK